MASIYILLAAFFVQGAHSYLLYTQRGNRKWSLSRHATDSKRSRTIYRLGHLLGGAAWLIAMDMLFNQPSDRFIFHIAILTVAFQWLQALVLINTQKIVSIHAMFAYPLWVCSILMIVLSTIYLPIAEWQRMLASTLAMASILIFLYMNLHRSSLWNLQYVSIYGFFAAYFVLSL